MTTTTAQPRRKRDSFASVLRLHRYSPRTVRLYVNTIRNLEAWLAERDLTIARAPTETFLDYAATLPFTYASQMRLVTALKAYWRLYLKRPDPTPAHSIRCPKPPNPVFRGLDDGADARAVIEAARTWGPAAVAACSLLYYAALRCHEAASLRREDDQGEWLSVLGKGARPRTLPIGDALRLALDEQRAYLDHSPKRFVRESAFFFPSRAGQSHVHTNTVALWVKMAGAAAGLGHVTPHVLRRTAGATMLDSTQDLRATATYLGHSMHSLSVTANVYTRTRAETLQMLERTL